MVPDDTRNPPSPPVVSEHCPAADRARDVLEYDDESNTYRASFDARTGSVCLDVVFTVALVSGTDPTELEPLSSTVDPDALEALVDPSASGSSHSDVGVQFTLAGCDVTVHSYGVIAVRPPDDGCHEPERG